MNMTLPVACLPVLYCAVLPACSITKTVQYPRMLLQLLQAGFSVGHVPDMNYLTRPVRPVCAGGTSLLLAVNPPCSALSCLSDLAH